MKIARKPWFLAPVFVSVSVLLAPSSVGAVDPQQVRGSLVEVFGVNRLNREFAIGTGAIVNLNGYVVTVGQNLIREAKAIRVSPLPADVGTRFDVDVRSIRYHPSLELVLLNVPELRGPPLTIGYVEGLEQRVFTARTRPVSLYAGTIKDLVIRPVEAYGRQEHRFIAHDAEIVDYDNENADNAKVGYGTPLLDVDGNVIGINHLDPSVTKRDLNRDRRPGADVFAVSETELRAFLESQGVTFASAEPPDEPQPTAIATQPVTDDSPSSVASELRRRELEEARLALERERRAREDTEAAALEARQKANEMERRVQQAESRSATSERERTAARQAADLASAVAEEAERNAEMASQRASEAEERAAELRRAIDAEVAAREEAASEARRNLYMAAAIGVGAVVVGLLGWLIYSRRSSKRVASAEERAVDAEHAAQHAREEAEEAERLAGERPSPKLPAPFDVLMEGRGPDGKRFTCKVTRESLSAPTGVVVGRHPQYASVVVEHEGLSREHAKLTVADRVLYIDDLESTNGTFVDNVAVRPGTPSPVRNGAGVKLGPVTFSVTLI